MTESWVYLDVATRRYVYRASSLGSCTRSLTAARLGESATGPHANLRAAMDASAGLEDVILERAEQQLGVSITGRQDTVDLEVGVVCEGPDGKELRNIVVRGHPDGKTDDCVIEAKALGDTYWDRYNDGGSTGFGIFNPDPLFVKYRIQAAIYGHATGLPVRFAIGHKEKWEEMDGRGVATDKVQYKVAGFHLGDPIPAEELFSLDDIHTRIRTIEEHAAMDLYPDCDGGCREGDPYSEVHFFATPTVGDDELEKLCQRDRELDELIAALQEEKDELRRTVKESYPPGKYTAGPYTLHLVKKNPSRFDSKAFRKRHPDLYEEYKVAGMPYVEMRIT